MKKQIGLRLDEVEIARLQRLADHYGLTPTNVVRMLVTRASDELRRTQVR
jgi:antitoxin component of RelBE/YafQ-DinJ toxin-antitoxin module